MDVVTGRRGVGAVDGPDGRRVLTSPTTTTTITGEVPRPPGVQDQGLNAQSLRLTWWVAGRKPETRCRVGRWDGVGGLVAGAGGREQGWVCGVALRLPALVAGG